MIILVIINNFIQHTQENIVKISFTQIQLQKSRNNDLFWLHYT